MIQSVSRTPYGKIREIVKKYLVKQLQYSLALLKLRFHSIYSYITYLIQPPDWLPVSHLQSDWWNPQH